MTKQTNQKNGPSPNSTKEDCVSLRATRVRRLLPVLKRLFPDARIALRYDTPWELLVAVMLSAQCTDAVVNRVTERLFRDYPDIEAYARAPLRELERAVHATGFFHMKAKHIQKTAQEILTRFGGMVPRTMEELVSLPGVGRKTAHVVLGNAFGIVEGITVDTHVRRFALRFALTESKDPVRIERDLMLIVPRKEWVSFTYRVIEYGRRIAPARKYDTSKDPLIAIYPPAGEVFRV